MVTVWLTNDRSDLENGCMRVIPGTYRKGVSEYEAADLWVSSFDSQIINVDESKAVDFELDPDECSQHDTHMVHGAKPNTSPWRRTGYTMHYFSISTRIYPEKNPGHLIWLARDKNPVGNTYVNN